MNYNYLVPMAQPALERWADEVRKRQAEDRKRYPKTQSNNTHACRVNKGPMFLVDLRNQSAADILVAQIKNHGDNVTLGYLVQTTP